MRAWKHTLRRGRAPSPLQPEVEVRPGPVFRRPTGPHAEGTRGRWGALAGAARGEEHAVTMMDPARRGEVGCGERSWCGSRALSDVRTALDFRGRDFTPMAEPG